MPVHTVKFEQPAALVLVDLQKAIDDPKWGQRNNYDAEEHIRSVLDEWRRLKWPIIHVRHDSTNPLSPYRPGQAGNEFKSVATPIPHETVIPKRTNSAFVGTNFHQILTEKHIDTLVVCGVLTHNSLEATVRNAGNLGYRVFVPENCCWSVDKKDLRGKQWLADDVHHLSLANMHGEYATVTAAQHVLDALPRE